MSSAASRLALRRPVGTPIDEVVAKAGIVLQVRGEGGGPTREVHAIGGACSEAFTGPRLAKILGPGLAAEHAALERMAHDDFAPCLSTHTSLGVPETLTTFVDELEGHLPWAMTESQTESPTESPDWFVTLQAEGASAVWAACDLLMQLQHDDAASLRASPRTKIAVGCTSYHGPGFNCLGSASPLGQNAPIKGQQLDYPVPTFQHRRAGEPEADFHGRIEAEYDAFLDAHAHEVAVLLVEPQWGSSALAEPWPDHVLRSFVSKAQQRGILVCADEIFCGLGRHGRGTTFASRALDLPVDAVTFGKAIGGGAGHLLSGVAVRRGAAEMGRSARSVLQMHTYAASSLRALSNATGTLRELPAWHGHIQESAARVAAAFEAMAHDTAGQVQVQGQGLIWGARWAHNDLADRRTAMAHLREACEDVGVLPYFVENEFGFLATPVLDVDATQLDEALAKLHAAVLQAAHATHAAPRLQAAGGA